MADEAQRGLDRPVLLMEFRARLFGRLPLLGAIAAVFLVMLLIGHLGPFELILGYLAVSLIAVLLPESGAVAGAGASARGTAPAVTEAVRLFSEALPEPCIVLDARGIVLHRNAETARNFPAIALGTPLTFSLRSPGLLAAVEQAQRGQQSSMELHQTVPTETWYRVTISPMATGTATSETLLVITMQSLTEAKRLESLRSDFIANASHELRTPLTSLVGFIDTLLGPASNDAEARKRFLTLMRAQAARMSKLIEDLLSLSRIEMRQHVRPSAKVDLGGLVREVVEAMHNLAEDNGVKLTAELPAEQMVVPGDRDELYEVIENLIDNALKYGGDGGKVEVVLGPATGRQGFDAAISVTDHGPGVAPEHVPRLTERFYRVDAESSRKKKGTGLGLAIVKHIVTRHHGLLTIRSQPGQGTRVEVLLRR